MSDTVGAMERANKAGVAAALAVAALGRSYDTREELERAHLPITRAAVLAFLDPTNGEMVNLARIYVADGPGPNETTLRAQDFIRALRALAQEKQQS